MNYQSLHSAIFQLSIDAMTDKDFQIPHSTFFSELFESPDDAFSGLDVFYKTLSGNHPFTILTAPPKGGKTTLLYKTSCDNANSNESIIYTHIIDMNKRICHLTLLKDSVENPEILYRHLYLDIRKSIIDNIIIDADMIYNVGFAILNLYYSFDLKHSLMLNMKSKPLTTCVADSEEAFQNLALRDNEILKQIHNLVMHDCELNQLIVGIKRVLGIDKFILAYDNTDPLHQNYLNALFSLSVDLQHVSNNEYSTVLSIRTKNIKRYHASGAYGDVISIEHLKHGGIFHTVPMHIPSATRRMLESVVYRRYAFMYKSKIVLTTAIDTECKVFIELNIKSILNIYHHAELYHIANSRIGQYLHLHNKFIIFLLTSLQDDQNTDIQPNTTIRFSLLNSYFYRWLHKTFGEAKNLLMSIDQRAPKDDVLLRDIDLVILAWLINNGRSDTKVWTLVDRMSTIYGDKTEILKSIMRLYDDNVFHRYIEIGDSEMYIREKMLRKNNFHIEITPLGRYFAKRLITKFEYLCQCINLRAVSITRNIESMPMRDDTRTKTRNVLLFVRRISLIHSQSLVKIRLLLGSKDWETRYRSEFCVNNKLIVERMITDHLRYVKKHYYDEYDFLRQEYDILLDDFYRSFRGRSAQK